ncbi:hypothetical protein BDBG_00549 [Blastomyces gilchristii SLH14081]|uniref:DUF3835 domain-containing protein n=1 Tax=Blastomyces gilchristii (strain SLH14081) TaxID=559298 RepID=A0A179U782_BLAGS|nr:uncharacterized protein BDBG_00549 [Blastomyces gilchristii SLH14081]OAT03885.1 hypothetical protein BDBG_00549 [Blastomyces gilchristii SLH14081]
MAQPTDHLASLERQRLQLEDSILELRKSLYNWRMWHAEYDELKNTISELEENSEHEDFLKIGREFGGSLVNEDEIKVLLGVKHGVTRTKEQVVDAISRRMDYVQQNIGVLEKRVSAAEGKLEAILTVQHPGAVDEEGLPITDIVEELDGDDRVVSSSTTTPEQAAPGILEALKKAGMDLSKEKTDDKPSLAEEGKSDTSLENTDSVRRPDSSLRVEEIPSTKGVSNTKSDTATTATEATPPLDATTESAAGLGTTANTFGIENNNRSLVLETAHTNDATADIDIDEPPEDAALRREMLQYSLEEVGAVVAELELDESGSEFSIEDEYYVMSDEDDEEEDEYGRSTRRMIDDDYRRQMVELEKKLNARSLENVGPDTSSLPPEIREEMDAPTSTKVVPNTGSGKVPKKKKKVAFADALDLAPDPAALTPPAPIKEHRVESPSVPVVQDAIVERAQAEKVDDTKGTTAPKKASRFRSARNASEPTSIASTSAMPGSATRPSAPSTNAPPLPLFPAKPSQPKPFSQPIVDPDQPPKALADKLVERTVSHENATPPDPDELDESLHKQEIATEFYKFRNRKVHQEGGFLRDGEENDGIIPLDEDGQPPKRLSRFMAARVK